MPTSPSNRSAFPAVPDDHTDEVDNPGEQQADAEDDDGGQRVYRTRQWLCDRQQPSYQANHAN
jgi:hypothetical protein